MILVIRENHDPTDKGYATVDKVILLAFWCHQQSTTPRWQMQGKLGLLSHKAWGLGIRDLEKFGRGLRIRWLWFQWKCPDKPWCRLNLPVDEVDRALFAATTRVMVHNGKTAKFWQSRWLDGNAPATMFPTLYSHSRRKNRTVANAMKNNNWITDLVHSLSALNCHDQDEELVEAAGFSGHDQDEDEITWARTSDGLYSARSAYTLQFEGSLMTSFPTLVWRIWRLQSANSSCGSSCNAGYGLPTGFNEGSGQISIFAHFVAVTWRRRNTFLRTPFFSTITVRSLLEHEEYVRAYWCSTVSVSMKMHGGLYLLLQLGLALGRHGHGRGCRTSSSQALA
jgi:hypothetical protein